MKKITFLLLTLTLFFSAGWSQSDSQIKDKDVEKGNAQIAIQIGAPLGTMQRAIKNNMGNLGFGIGVSLLTNPFSWDHNKRNSPLRIGGEFGYTYYGRYISKLNLNGHSGDYKTSYGILQANGLFRLCTPNPSVAVRPFIEILAGGNLYISSTKENLGIIETAFGVEKVNIADYTSISFNKGLAIGCRFGKKERWDDPGRFLLRISYNTGSNIKYMVRGSLTYDGASNKLQYQEGRAKTQYIMVHIGIGI